MLPRKRFFGGFSTVGEGSDLPTINMAIPSPPSSGRISPSRCQSSPAASVSGVASVMRQRGSPTIPAKTIKWSAACLEEADSYYLPLNCKVISNNGSDNRKSSVNMLQAVLVLALLTLTITRVCLNQSNTKLSRLLAQRDNKLEHQLDYLTELEGQMRRRENERTQLQNQIVQLEQRPAVGDDSLEAQRRVFHLEHSTSMIQQGIQVNARKMVQEKFGSGPYYYVEMKLSIPTELSGDQDMEHTGNTILIETANLHDMPHSVHLFLEQVAHELYDGTVFYKNADPVLLVGPGTNQLALDKFQSHPSLNSVLFQEYSPRMPHERNTLGYAGRPGGPNFFINLDDNTRFHGPGGQQHYEHDLLVADADPCFAKIIQGQGLVDRLAMATIEVDGRDTQPILIETMRIVHGPAMTAVTQEA